MRREETCLGMFVRLLSDWHGIPKGTVGSIDTVERGSDGSWSFTVFWELHRPLRSTMPGRTRARTGLESGSLGLRLWEEDLPRFEVISQEQRDVAALHVAPPADTSPTMMCLFSSEAVDQLTLPFTDRDLITDRELVEDDHPQLLFASVGASAP
ncbi:MAG TPA: hypothetical protein VFQ06_03165 [Nitrospira sp.]|nr:hypothetical protein [Nitrospira sp.]